MDGIINGEEGQHVQKHYIFYSGSESDVERWMVVLLFVFVPKSIYREKKNLGQFWVLQEKFLAFFIWRYFSCLPILLSAIFSNRFCYVIHILFNLAEVSHVLWMEGK